MRSKGRPDLLVNRLLDELNLLNVRQLACPARRRYGNFFYLITLYLFYDFLDFALAAAAAAACFAVVGDFFDGCQVVFLNNLLDFLVCDAEASANDSALKLMIFPAAALIIFDCCFEGISAH